MKIKIVVVDLELSRRQKAALAAGLGAALSMVGAVAVADVPHEFATGDTLTADDLNENFADLDARITAQDARLSDNEAAVGEIGAPRTSISLSYPESFGLPSGVFTRIPFVQVVHDDLDEYDVATSQFVPSEAGDYQVCAAQLTDVSVKFELSLFINDTRVRAFAISAPSTPNSHALGCTVVRLAAGSRMDVRAYQASGTAVTSVSNGLWSWMDIQRL